MFDLRRPARRSTAFIAGAAVLLAACGAGDSDANDPPAVPPSTSPTDTGTAPDDITDGDSTSSEAAPGDDADMDSTAILGAVLDAGSVIGDAIDLAAVDGRPVVAWFWAPWCTICRAEGPTVAAVAETYGDRIVLVGVPGRGDATDMERFIDDTGTRGLTHIADLSGGIWSQFGVFAQPAFAFISADGQVDVWVGSLGERGLVDRIESLVQA